MTAKKLLLISSFFLLSISVLSSEDSGVPMTPTLESYAGAYDTGTFKLLCPSGVHLEVLEDDLVIFRGCASNLVTFYRCDRETMRCTVDPAQSNPEYICEKTSLKLLKGRGLLFSNPCGSQSSYYYVKREPKTCS